MIKNLFNPSEIKEIIGLKRFNHINSLEYYNKFQKYFFFSEIIHD